MTSSARTLAAPARVRGVIQVPGDKSISHRALLLAALATGRSSLRHRAPGEDQASMVRCLRQLGVEITESGEATVVEGLGLRGLRQPTADLDCGNSGNTMRFLTGAVAATPGVRGRLVGDASLSRRPMLRVATPLRLLGAGVEPAAGGTAPIDVTGARLRGGSVTIEVPSAQVKTAVLLAALQADGVTAVNEAVLTRDHTERLMRLLGVDIRVDQAVTIQPPPRLQPFDLTVPGDPSAAAFFTVLAAVHPDARLTLPGVCLNPTRTGFLEVLARMGASIKIENQRQEAGELVGDIDVASSALRGVEVAGWEIPTLVDEVPILAVAACAAAGTTRFRGLAELRHKEVDRVAAVQAQLRAMGARIEVDGDDLIVEGDTRLVGASVSSLGDHRMAMALAVAASCAAGETRLQDPGAASVSYPGFLERLAEVSEGWPSPPPSRPAAY
ncbi:MAG: 3-phosphoshikimate 1-carboxyvinyltransferase [Candidatus Dormibacteria bacterium]